MSGVWEKTLWDELQYADILNDPTKWVPNVVIGNGVEVPDPYANTKACRGLSWMGNGDICNAYTEGTNIEVKVRKIKALKASPNRSGVQINRTLVQGNKLVFRYVAHGELTRPL